MVTPAGFEPTLSAWEADLLNHLEDEAMWGANCQRLFNKVRLTYGLQMIFATIILTSLLICFFPPDPLTSLTRAVAARKPYFLAQFRQRFHLSFYFWWFTIWWSHRDSNPDWRLERPLSLPV